MSQRYQEWKYRTVSGGWRGCRVGKEGGCGDMFRTGCGDGLVWKGVVRVKVRGREKDVSTMMLRSLAWAAK